mmetsp:Transcript_32271/g.77333  ORF Transcript_32271/g.77333 Transcript_32271/m.77333 type:complete len:203 (+) Transcript_32271:361-969(+)
MCGQHGRLKKTRRHTSIPLHLTHLPPVSHQNVITSSNNVSSLWWSKYKALIWTGLCGAALRIFRSWSRRRRAAFSRARSTLCCNCDALRAKRSFVAAITLRWNCFRKICVAGSEASNLRSDTSPGKNRGNSSGHSIAKSRTASFTSGCTCSAVSCSASRAQARGRAEIGSRAFCVPSTANAFRNRDMITVSAGPATQPETAR